MNKTDKARKVNLQVKSFAGGSLADFDPFSLERFLQGMANRALVGHIRYGAANSRKKYLSRMEMELKEYKKTKNSEHLFNVAVYAWLESEHPQLRGTYLDTGVGSATRGRI